MRLNLTEYQSISIAQGSLSAAQAAALHTRYGKQLVIEAPGPSTEQQWRVTAQGWIGHLPVDETLSVTIHPKPPLRSVFGMLEYVYDLSSLKFHKDLVASGSLDEFYENLADIFGHRVLSRHRHGFYRSYVERDEVLPFARGRLDVPGALRYPHWPYLPWEYEEHTPDIDDNQLLAWTLHWLTRAPIRRADVQRCLREAYRCLHGLVALTQFCADDCLNRTYHRLNEDYATLHALCRFFLEHSGPQHAVGSHDMIPFMLEMSTLFEEFVARWLARNLPGGLRITPQYPFSLPRTSLRFYVDLVIFDEADRPVCLIDTKYKAKQKPTTDDIAQVVAYAHALSCLQAVLVYPMALEEPLSTQVGDVHVRSISYDLNADLDESGGRMLQRLVGLMELPGAGQCHA